MTGLWRCHFAMSHVLELMQNRRVEEAAATAVQVLKAIHQTALDGGSWNSSDLLLPWDDPLARDLFGGDEEEMMATAAWNRGVKDLQSQVASLSHGGPTAHQMEDSSNGPAYQPTRSNRRPAAAAKARAAKATPSPGAKPDGAAR